MALLLSKTSTSLDSDKSVSLGVVNRLLAASQADPQTSSHQMSSRSSLPLPVEELHGLPCFLPVELIDFGLGLDTTAGEDWSRNRDSFVSELLSTGFIKVLGMSLSSWVKKLGDPSTGVAVLVLQLFMVGLEYD